MRQIGGMLGSDAAPISNRSQQVQDQMRTNFEAMPKNKGTSLTNHDHAKIDEMLGSDAASVSHRLQRIQDPMRTTGLRPVHLPRAVREQEWPRLVWLGPGVVRVRRLL